MKRRGGAAAGERRLVSAGHLHPLAASVALMVLCLALAPLGPSVAAGDVEPGSRPSAAEVAGPRLGSAPRIETGYRPANEPVAPRGDAGIIDTSDRDAVNTAYRQRYLQPRTVLPEWTGSVATCTAGSVSAAFSAAALETVDYFRNLAGLPGVSFASRLDTPSQAAALIMDASDSLTHSPQPDAPCYTEAGRLGAGSSNLAIGAIGARAIGLYMHDYGANNTAVGHRRWILYPPQTTLGSGSTTSTDALYVLDTDTWVRPSDGPDWIFLATARLRAQCPLLPALLAQPRRCGLRFRHRASDTGRRVAAGDRGLAHSWIRRPGRRLRGRPRRSRTWAVARIAPSPSRSMVSMSEVRR